jgi:DNA-binding MarR family transcriptional regulator
MRVSDLALALRISVASASALRKRLTRLGYVTRQHGVEDQRTVLLALSPKGERLIAGLARRSTNRLSSTIERMTGAERDALAVTLRAMVRLADEPTRRPIARARRAT